MRIDKVAGIAGIALAVTGVAGCASAQSAPVPSTPITYLQGKWTCEHKTPEGTDKQKWTFTITKTQISVLNGRPGAVPGVEDYVLEGGSLTLTDSTRGFLQQGYKSPATVQFPSAMPAVGKEFDTEVLLPNTDKWGLKITVNGNTAAIQVSDPQNESWACTRN
jgi:hypothetical protein